MIKLKIFFSALLAINLITISANGEENIKDTLVVKVTDLDNNIGKVIVNLFRKGDDLMGKPFLQLKTEIKSEQGGS